jgi:hypothetical protein
MRFSLSVREARVLAPIEPPRLALIPAPVFDLRPADACPVAIGRGPVLEDDPLEPAVLHVLDERHRRLDQRAHLQRHVEGLSEQLQTVAAFLPGQTPEVGAEQHRHVEGEEAEGPTEPLRAVQR